MRSSGNGSEKGGKWIILFPAAGIFFYGLYYVNLCLGFHALDGGSYGGAGTDSDRQCFLAVYCLFPFLCTGRSCMGYGHCRNHRRTSSGSVFSGQPQGGIIFIPALTLHGGSAESLQQWSLTVSNRTFHVLSGHGL